MVHRSYDQYCPIAVALDVVGDRWTLFILRELTIGDRRSRPEGGAARHRPEPARRSAARLQADGLVEQRELPPPAARTVYTATAGAKSVVPVLRALARFGAERLGPPDGAAVGPRWPSTGCSRLPPPGAARRAVPCPTGRRRPDVRRRHRRPAAVDHRGPTSPRPTCGGRGRDLVAARQGARRSPSTTRLSPASPGCSSSPDDRGGILGRVACGRPVQDATLLGLAHRPFGLVQRLARVRFGWSPAALAVT